MALYDRLMGIAGEKIPVHQFQSTVAEYARGQMTAQQAQDAINAITKVPLTPAEVTEAQTLLNTVTGTATNKLARAKEIDDVLMIAELKVVANYQTSAQVKTRLGV